VVLGIVFADRRANRSWYNCAIGACYGGRDVVCAIAFEMEEEPRIRKSCEKRISASPANCE
jgi:hypothetical protein